MKALAAAATVAVVILSLSFALLFFAATDSPSDPYPLDKACYSIFDRTGREFKSWFPPVPAESGVFTFNNDHTWGYVFGPSAMVADRDCLRERYPGDEMVPPLQGTDD